MVFVVAETLDEAKKQAADGFIYRFGYKQQNKGTFLAEKLDEPDRVLELPCAEWHEWQEWSTTAP